MVGNMMKNIEDNTVGNLMDILEDDLENNMAPGRRGAMQMHGATPLCSLRNWVPVATNSVFFLL